MGSLLNWLISNSTRNSLQKKFLAGRNIVVTGCTERGGSCWLTTDYSVCESLSLSLSPSRPGRTTARSHRPIASASSSQDRGQDRTRTRTRTPLLLPPHLWWWSAQARQLAGWLAVSQVTLTLMVQTVPETHHAIMPSCWPPNTTETSNIKLIFLHSFDKGEEKRIS